MEQDRVFQVPPTTMRAMHWRIRRAGDDTPAANAVWTCEGKVPQIKIISPLLPGDELVLRQNVVDWGSSAPTRALSPVWDYGEISRHVASPAAGAEVVDTLFQGGAAEAQASLTHYGAAQAVQLNYKHARWLRPTRLQAQAAADVLANPSTYAESILSIAGIKSISRMDPARWTNADCLDMVGRILAYGHPVMRHIGVYTLHGILTGNRESAFRRLANCKPAHSNRLAVSSAYINLNHTHWALVFIDWNARIILVSDPGPQFGNASAVATKVPVIWV